MTWTKPYTGTAPFLTHGYLKDSASDPYYDANSIFKTDGATLNIIAHGDSMTLGKTANESYLPKLVRSLYTTNSVKANYKQRGINGQGFTYVYDSTNAPNSLTAEAATEIDACISGSLTNWLIVWAGTNDAKLGAQTPATLRTNFQNYISARISAGWAADHIIVCTMLPRETYNETNRSTINSNFVTDAGTYGYVVAAMHNNASIGAAGQQNNTTYFTDTIHLTDVGQNIAMGIIKTAMGY